MGSRVGLACFTLAALGTGLTVIYSVRLSLGVFMVKARREAFSQEVDIPNLILFGMGGLIFGGVYKRKFFGIFERVGKIIYSKGSVYSSRGLYSGGGQLLPTSSKAATFTPNMIPPANLKQD